MLPWRGERMASMYTRIESNYTGSEVSHKNLPWPVLYTSFCFLQQHTINLAVTDILVLPCAFLEAFDLRQFFCFPTPRNLF
jgi:hypothetical protein